MAKYHFLLAAALASAALASPAALATPKHHRFGAFDPVFTPFYANGTLNLAAVPGYAKWTTDCGTDTIILGGSTGEWPSMTSTERLATLRAWSLLVILKMSLFLFPPFYDSILNKVKFKCYHALWGSHF